MFPLRSPTEDSARGEIARQLVQLRGPSISAGDGTVAAARLLGIGGALADAQTTIDTAIAQAFASTATDTLPVWEDVLDIPVDDTLSDADRQLRLTTILRTLLGGRPDALLLIARAFDPIASIVEITATDAIALAYPRTVYSFAIAVAPATLRNRVAAVTLADAVSRAKPSHTKGTVGAYNAGNVLAFLTDDPNSLTDFTLLGV